jgi:phenylpropionate dioxygenase-like ring-hydroxylating dioxygenase large terminal subunit
VKTIATQVDDTTQYMREKIAAENATVGTGLDGYFYRSHLVYERELSALVYRSWIYACHSSELENAGDYVQLEIDEDAFIISRDADGGIHAMVNVCRHRGARVCEAKSGNVRTFVCPYHGWVYNTDGSLRAARHVEAYDTFEPEKLGLKKLQVEVFEGLVFINCDLEGESFGGPLENIRRQLGAYNFASAKIAHRHVYQVDANWKFCVENYMECYHCATSHRAYARMHSLADPSEIGRPAVEAMLAKTEEITGVKGIGDYHFKTYSDAESFGACCYHSRYALYGDGLTGSEDGKSVAPLMGNIRGYDGGVGCFQMGPLTFMLNYPDHGVLYRFIPRGLTATDMEVIWFVNGDAVEGVDYDVDRLIWLWNRTSLEDEYIITRNSEGVNSRFFKPGPLHPEFESWVVGFNKWYIHSLGHAS